MKQPSFIKVERAQLAHWAEALKDLGMKHYEHAGEALHRDAYEAMQEALARPGPEPDPVAWECKGGGLKPLTQRQYDAQPENIRRHYTRIAPPPRKEPGQQEPVAVYGYCPECGAEGVSRERRADGNDCCANGHRYPSRTSNKTPQRKPLTEEFGIQEYVDIGQYSLQVIFKDRPSADRFKADHGIKGNT